MARLEGTFTALYTPFHADGSVDLRAYEALCERVAAAGSGLVPCGTTGETPTLSRDEYVACVKTAVAVGRGRVPVIAGTGSSSTEATVETTALARSLGADMALVVTPPYNKPPQKALLAHFRAVADVGLPVLLYNVPGRTGVHMAASTTLDLAKDPRFVGIKEASGNLREVEALVAGTDALGNGFAVLSGDDGLTLPMVALGAHGVVSVASNVAPDAVVSLVKSALANETSAARALHYRLRPLFEALFLTSNPIPVKRAAMRLGHARDAVRMPLMALGDDEADKKIDAALASALAHAGLA